MADFRRAVEVMLSHEGGWSDDPTDPGGRTRWGISQRSYPDVDVENLTREAAIAIYRRDWWDRYGYGAIVDQALATKIFDLAVNVGAKRAHMLLQQALRAAGATVRVDGVLGPATIAAIAAVKPGELLAALRSEAAGFYRILELRSPPLGRFINGWLNRAYS